MMSKETDNFYSKGKRHWENVSATISGMLGGFAKVDKADIRASARFIDGFLKDKECPLRPDYALDCGSGIGRISKHLLLKVFKNIDMVEQNLNFLNESHLYLGEDNCRVLNRYNCGLQDFVPPPNKYDLIWVQWVIGYLKDDDLIRCLQHLKDGLRKNGIIVLKENISNDGQSVEHMDGSITRTRDSLLHIFNEAGLELVSERRQVKFPKKLLQVKMFALM